MESLRWFVILDSNLSQSNADLVRLNEINKTIILNISLAPIIVTIFHFIFDSNMNLLGANRIEVFSMSAMSDDFVTS